MATRTRVTRKAIGGDNGNLNKEMKRLVDEVADAQQRIVLLNKQIENDLRLLHENMKAAGVFEVIGDEGKGERFTPSGRGSTIIDKKAYFEKVSLDEFLESSTVSVTKAKDFLSGKELQSISKKIPGEQKPETVRVVPIA